MKKKTLIIITSILAVGLIGFAGFQSSAIYTAAGDDIKNSFQITEESAGSFSKLEKADSDKKQAQSLVNLNMERDDIDDDRTNDNTGKQNIISKEEAISIAKKQYAGQIKEVEFDIDDDNGKQEYEIEILTKRGEVELEIDAKTGKILSADFDD